VARLLPPAVQGAAPLHGSLRRVRRVHAVPDLRPRPALPQPLLARGLDALLLPVEHRSQPARPGWPGRDARRRRDGCLHGAGGALKWLALPLVALNLVSLLRAPNRHAPTVRRRLVVTHSPRSFRPPCCSASCRSRISPRARPAGARRTRHRPDRGAPHQHPSSFTTRWCSGSGRWGWR
jgi:hypothetical protein